MSDEEYLHALRERALAEARALVLRLSHDEKVVPHVIVDGLRQASRTAERLQRIAGAAEVVRCAG